MPLPVGVIGLGAMGSGMARNLVKAGFEVWVRDVRPEPVQQLVADGARVAASPRELGERGDVILCVLRDFPQIQHAVLGDGGVLAGMRPGGILVVCSTISPADVRGVGEAAAARGVRLLDAPMSGGDRRAADGTLTLMLAGDRQALDVARPVLEVVGKHLYVCGDRPGDGQTVKMINQLLVSVNFVAIAEALVLAAKSGLDLALVYEVIKNCTGDSWAWRDRAPGVIARDFSTRGALDIQVKDMGIVLETGRRLGVPLLLGGLIHQMYLMAQGKGLGAEDVTAVVKLVDEWAGLPAARGG